MCACKMRAVEKLMSLSENTERERVREKGWGRGWEAQRPNMIHDTYDEHQSSTSEGKNQESGARSKCGKKSYRALKKKKNF